MLQPGVQDELRHEHLPSLSGEGTRWQLYQVSLQFVPNQKCRGFHLCLLHFLSLISSLWNWKWQGNYHFILNWSQSMWAGSRHRDKRGEETGRKERREKKIFGSIWRWFSHLYDVSLGGWGGMEAGGGETFWRLHCGCSLDVPMTGTRLGDARRRRFGFFICLAPPGFSWPVQARFWDSVARRCSQPVA